MSQCGSSMLMRSQRQLKTSVHVHRSVLLTSTSLSLHKSTQVHPGNTLISSKWKIGILLYTIEDSLTSAIFSTICGTGIFTSAISSTFCETGIFTICSSSPVFPNAYQIQQLKHRLCVLLNHAVPVMDHSTDLHKSDTHCIERKVERRITCSLQRMIKQSDSPCQLQSTCCVCVNSRIPLVCSKMSRAVVTVSVSE